MAPVPLMDGLSRRACVAPRWDVLPKPNRWEAVEHALNSTGKLTTDTGWVLMPVSQMAAVDVQ